MPPLNPLQKKCLALAISQSLISTAQAATIEVNNSGDAGVGCTLREAIMSANTSIAQNNGCATGSDADTDEILFNPTEFSNNSTIVLTAGQLDLQNKNIQINAQAISNGVTVSAAGASRVMQVSGGDVSINNLTLTGGSSAESGGGLQITSGASVSLTDSQVSNNVSSNNRGGGIRVSDSSLHMQNSEVSGNSASTSGGGINAGGGAVVELHESEISNNTIFGVTSSQGGGLYAGGNFEVGDNTSIKIMNSAVSSNGNTAVVIANRASLDLIDSTVENNTGSTGGLSILGQLGSVNIARSRFAGNFGDNGGGMRSSDKTITIADTTFSNNRALLPTAGSAFTFESGSITLLNTTISNNMHRETDAGTAGYIRSADVTFNHVTMSDNSLMTNNVIGSDLVVLVGSLTMQNSIIGNSITTMASCFVGTSVGGQVTLDSASIIQDGTCGALRNGDPGLLSLQDNGGPTETNALSQNSISINTGDTNTCLQTDQRGATRDALCDVGAFEFGAELADEDPNQDVQTFVIPLANGRTVIFDL